MSDDFLRRLEAVERAVSDGRTDLTAVSDAAATTERLARVEARVDDLEAELATLDGRLQAIRGYLGGVDGVSADVEQRADLALAKATELEAVVFDERDGLVVERLPNVEGAPATRRPERADSDDAGSATGREPGETDRGADGSLVGHLRGALGQ